MSPASLERGNNNPVWLEPFHQSINRDWLYQRIVDKEQHGASRVRRQRPDAGLKGGNHTQFVIRIKYGCGQRYGAFNLLAITAQNDNGMVDGGLGYRGQNVLQECSSP